LTRVGVVDIGSNSTRLLVADVEDGRLTELERRTTITGLAQGVDATGELAQEAMDRVAEAVAAYREVIDRCGAERVVAVATSAMRDAANGPAFRDFLRERFDIDARTISGDDEAKLTFLGATAGREDDVEVVVIDIGGGSTEYVLGRPGAEPSFNTSTQMGGVRHTERFLHSDPPKHEELQALAASVRETVPSLTAGHAIAVGGTATSIGSIEGSEVVSLAACERITAMLAALPVEERRNVKGLHPDRAPTIVAGAVILTESIRSFDLTEVETSDRDILHGATAL
jgi:exopolyphosphatase/guanosine-5'-triphosphate,3'-diphosphate pyrophosphatase